MKTNKQILKLMENGFRPSTLQNLTDGQINALYTRIVEQITPMQKTSFKIGPGGGTLPANAKGYSISVNKATDVTTATPIESEMKEGETNKKIDRSELKFLKNLYKNAPTEKIKNMITKLENEISKSEMKEDDEDVVQAGSIKGGASTQAPHQIQAPDGMDDEGDEEINKAENISEARKKKSKAKNPWAICTSTMGKEFGTTERSDWTKKQMNKYERCVMDVKKSMKEGKNPFEVILERQILSLMERELYPRMTKAELMKTISEKKKEIVVIDEAEPAPAPTKPDVKPDTRPTRRRRPGQVPGPDPAPKAKNPEEQKDKYMDIISKILRNEK